MIKKLLAAVFLLTLIFSLTAGCISEQKYYIGIDPDGTYPFIIVDYDTGDVSGFDVDSMRWIADYENLNIEFVICGWDNIINSLQAGEIDVIYSDMSVTDERKERINFSIPYISIKMAVAANHNYEVTMEDFFAGNTIIGVPSGTTSQDFVQDYFGKSYGRMVTEGRIKVYDSVDEMYLALYDGLIQTAVFEENSIKDLSRQNEDIYLLGYTGISEDIAVGIRKENTELLEKINHGMSALMNSEDWVKLKEKYGIE